MLAMAWWEALAERTVWLAAFVAALTMLSKTRPARWLWHTLVVHPLSDWARRVVGEVVDAKVAQPNGGSSVRDRLDMMTEQQAAAQKTLDTVVEWTAESARQQNDHAVSVERRFAEVTGRIDSLAAEVHKIRSDAR